MPFSCRIKRNRPGDIDSLWVEVTLTIISAAKGSVSHPFRFTTDFGATVVSEPVATALGLPAGGEVVDNIRLPAGASEGRKVSVRYRFPADTETGEPGVEDVSTWLVIPAPYDYARLGFGDVHKHFDLATDHAEMHFANR